MVACVVVSRSKDVGGVRIEAKSDPPIPRYFADQSPLAVEWVDVSEILRAGSRVQPE